MTKGQFVTIATQKRTFVVLPVLSTLLASACFAQQCDLSPVHFPGDSLQKTVAMMEGPHAYGANVPLVDAVLHFGDVVPDTTDPRGKNMVVPMMITSTYDIRELPAVWQRIVSQQAYYNDGCTAYSAQNFSWNIQDPYLKGTFNVRGSHFSCWWFYKGNEIPINIDVKHTIAATVAPDGSSMSITLQGEATGGIPWWAKTLAPLLGNIASVLPIGKLFKIDEQIFSGLDTLNKAMAEAGQFRLITSIDRPQIKRGGSTLTFVLSEAHFHGPNESPMLTITATKILDDGEACEIKETLLDQQHAEQAVTLAGTTHEMVNGESAWMVAKTFYGRGEYFPLLGATNNLSLTQLAALPVHTKLQIEPLYKIRQRTDVLLVYRGESMWKVANGDRINGISYQQLRERNKRWVADPNVVYPIQVLRLNEAARK